MKEKKPKNERMKSLPYNPLYLASVVKDKEQLNFVEFGRLVGISTFLASTITRGVYPVQSITNSIPLKKISDWLNKNGYSGKSFLTSIDLENSDIIELDRICKAPLPSQSTRKNKRKNIKANNNQDQDDLDQEEIMVSFETLKKFGLRENPFKAGIVEFIPNSAFTQGLDILKDKIQNGGFLLVKAPVGSGKTILFNRLLTHLATRSQDQKLIKVPSLFSKKANERWFSNKIIRIAEVGTALTNEERADMLEDAFNVFFENNFSLIILVDDSQKLSTDTLKDLRLLREEWTANGVKVTILLFAQPAISANMPMEVSRRIETLTLKPFKFPESEIQEYITTKIEKAGGNKDIFTLEAIQAIAERVHTPLQINNLCLRSMIAASRADNDKINRTIVLKA